MRRPHAGGGRSAWPRYVVWIVATCVLGSVLLLPVLRPSGTRFVATEVPELHRGTLQLPRQVSPVVSSASNKAIDTNHASAFPTSNAAPAPGPDGAPASDTEAWPPWQDAVQTEHFNQGNQSEQFNRMQFNQSDYATGKGSQGTGQTSTGLAAGEPQSQPLGASTMGTGALAPESGGVVGSMSPDSDTQEEGEESSDVGESSDLGYAEIDTSAGLRQNGGFFYILPNSIFGNSQKYFWKAIPEVGPNVACFVDALETHPGRVQDPVGASFFVVPLYRVAHVLRSGNESAITTILTDLRRNLNATRVYLDYGGARHVHMYPLSGTGRKLMAMLTDTLDVDIYSFLAASGKAARHWRCPHRHISIDLGKKPAYGASCGTGTMPLQSASTETPEQPENNPNLCDDGSFWCQSNVDSMLADALSRVQGREVWECGGPSSTPTNIVHEDFLTRGDRNRLFDYTFIDEEHHTLSCFMPKCASTVLKMMQKRQTGSESWNATDMRTRKEGLVRFADDASNDELRAILDDPRWVKYAVVRDPVIRTLSAYLHKIVQLRQKYYIHWQGKRRPSFAEFVEVLYAYPSIRQHNHHFIEQSSMCGHRAVHYNFIAHVETLHDDYEELFGRLGLWQSFGASGWGDDGSQSFLQAYQPSANHPSQLESSTGDVAVAKHYTREVLEKVYLMYREDFDRFGYSIDKWRRLVANNGVER